MRATHLRLGTHCVHRATNRSKAAVIVGAVVQTGIAWSVGNSPFTFLLWSTIFDAGKRKSSISSCK
jgi:hypothetical protein